MTVAMGVPGKLVGGELAGGVVTLSCHNDNPVRPVDDQRLVTGGVARRGDERDSWQHFGGAGHLLEAAAVDELGEGVVRCLPGGAEFCCSPVPSQRIVPRILPIIELGSSAVLASGRATQMIWMPIIWVCTTHAMYPRPGHFPARRWVLRAAPFLPSD